MAEKTYNNEAGAMGQALGASTPGTSQVITNLFAVAPDFATLASGDWIKLEVDPGSTTNYEILYLTAYTAGSVAGTITRAAEDSTNWPAVAHAAGATWVNGATTADFGLPSPPNGAAGGDLGGTYPNPSVAKIAGTALGTLSGATSGQVLEWNGTAWAPASTAASLPLTTEGDLVYQHSGSAARLPIGAAGSVLASNGTDPTWTAGAVTSQSGTAYTFAAGDANSMVVSGNASATVFTVPLNSSVPFPVGTTIVAIQGAAGSLTIAPASGVTIDGLSAVNRLWGLIALTQVATNVWVGTGTPTDPVNAVATSGATQTLLAGYMNRYVLSANCTLTLPPAVAGSSFTAEFVQPASGGPYTPTITSADYGAAGTPTWSTAASKKDLVAGYCSDGSTWQVLLSGVGF